MVKQAFIKGKAISFPGGDHDIIYIVFFKQSSRRGGIFKHAFYILHLLIIVDAMSRKKERRTAYNIATSQGSDLIYMTVIGQDHSVRGSRLLNIKSCLYMIVCIKSVIGNYFPAEGQNGGNTGKQKKADSPKTDTWKTFCFLIDPVSIVCTEAA